MLISRTLHKNHKPFIQPFHKTLNFRCITKNSKKQTKADLFFNKNRVKFALEKRSTAMNTHCDLSPHFFHGLTLLKPDYKQ